MSNSTIDRFEAQAPRLHQWIEGLSDADLDAHPVPGTWSIRQLVTHMTDAEVAYAHRLRRMVAESRPLIIGYDETRFAQNPSMQTVDLSLATTLFEAQRRWLCDFLRTIPAEAWERDCVHSERGVITVIDMLASLVWHLDHHEAFLVAKRAALKKPMAKAAGTTAPATTGASTR